jgi:hypothetical protein
MLLTKAKGTASRQKLRIGGWFATCIAAPNVSFYGLHLNFLLFLYHTDMAGPISSQSILYHTTNMSHPSFILLKARAHPEFSAEKHNNVGV